ncbi:uncharacterized protein LOC117537731 isoform X2 [Scomber scombrus]|uniref:Uncharacterized protein LOC117537731 isoform X2 n=1 Tax=Scomber scombrus TaxID=13677 RepID=A0AAV1PGT6_SCOSC
MSVLGEKDSASVKQLDSGIKCSWNWSWLKLKGKITVKGEAVSFNLEDVFRKIRRTYSERTFSNMRRFPFSLNLDESTSNNNKKFLSMLVCYYHEYLRKVMVEHLGSLEVVKVNAASLEKVLCEFFEKNNVPWKNLVSMLMDSCAVMRGSKTGIETRIHQYCRTLLDIDGDSCHHIHNAAKKFSEPFDSYLEKLFSDLHADHQ